MIIVTCIPAPGFDFYRCGWREEERDGRIVRVGFCWQAGTTELADDALTAEQIEMLKRDPGKRITVRQIPGVEPTLTAGKRKETAKTKDRGEAKEAPKDDEVEP